MLDPDASVEFSVIVPCHNEERVLVQLLEALEPELASITPNFEILLVDDGSRDNTLNLMRAAARREQRVRYLALSRNFGKEAAMLAGLSQARGAAVAIIDADLQHPPHLLAEMLPYLDRGYDQVVARRTRTGDKVGRSIASRLYYRAMNRMVDVKLEDGVGDFRVLSRMAVNGLLALGEHNRFSKGLFSWIGFDTAVVDYENVVRAAGDSKWGFRDLLNYGIDGVLSFNSKPLRSAIHLGAFVTAAAVLYAIWLIVDTMVRGVSSPGYVTIICAIVGFGGLQMIMLGIIGEYLGRIYLETKARPHFLLKETSEGLASPVAVLLGREDHPRPMPARPVAPAHPAPPAEAVSRTPQ